MSQFAEKEGLLAGLVVLLEAMYSPRPFLTPMRHSQFSPFLRPSVFPTMSSGQLIVLLLLGREVRS